MCCDGIWRIAQNVAQTLGKKKSTISLLGCMYNDTSTRPKHLFFTDHRQSSIRLRSFCWDHLIGITWLGSLWRQYERSNVRSVWEITVKDQMWEIHVRDQWEIHVSSLGRHLGHLGHLIPYELIWSNLISSAIIWSHPISSDILWSLLISSNLVWSDLISSDLAWPLLISSDHPGGTQRHPKGTQEAARRTEEAPRRKPKPTWRKTVSSHICFSAKVVRVTTFVQIQATRPSPFTRPSLFTAREFANARCEITPR